MRIFTWPVHSSYLGYLSRLPHDFYLPRVAERQLKGNRSGSFAYGANVQVLEPEDVCRGQFDLILLDMHMPRMGGLELLKQIRGLGVNVPVIMVTANADTRAAAEALSGGVFAYIPKPFDIRHLDHLVALAVSTGSSARGG